MLVPAIVVGAACAFIAWLFSDVSRGLLSSLLWFLLGFGFMQFFALFGVLDSLSAAQYEREADKLRARAGQTPSPSANV
jgi:hypothetical protein